MSAVIIRLESDSKALEVALFVLLLAPPALAFIPESSLKKLFKQKTPAEITDLVSKTMQAVSHQLGFWKDRAVCLGPQH